MRKDQDNNHPLSLTSQGFLCPNLFIRCQIYLAASVMAVRGKIKTTIIRYPLLLKDFCVLTYSSVAKFI
jgi:hypothetical protein